MSLIWGGTEPRDPLGPVRGVVLGLMLGAGLWVAVWALGRVAAFAAAAAHGWRP